MTQRIIYQNEFPYFVTCNTYYNKKFFNNFIYTDILNKNILYWIDWYKVILYSFCILPNHIHILFKLKNFNDVSLLMMKIKSKTVQDIHFWSQGKPCSVNLDFSSLIEHRLRCEPNQLIKQGSIWQPRYNFRIVNSENRLINTLNYIKYNYLKHGYDIKYSRPPHQFFNYDNIGGLL